MSPRDSDTGPSAPPSGVTPSVRIVDGPLRMQAPAHHSPGSGAVIRFLGVVRPIEQGKPISGLRYETYDPMAERMLESLATRVARDHGLLSIEVGHSRGYVGVDECSFELVVGAPHRREAMRAMDDFISTMKEDVPIWKHPVHEVPVAESPELRDPAAALDSLVRDLGPIGTETIALEDAPGRILAMRVRADRDSPPADVSAMDGFALRLDDLRRGVEGTGGSGSPPRDDRPPHEGSPPTLPIEGEASIGEPVATLAPGSGMRIFTGAPVPEGADLVVRREDVEEIGQPTDGIRLRVDPADLVEGLAIRRRGENGRAGDLILDPGIPVTSPVMGAMAAFGISRPEVFRPVRVSLIVTGNELVAVDDEPGPTAIRDSNGWALLGMLSTLPWIRVVSRVQVKDEVRDLEEALSGALENADAVFLTGGVSMGDHDHVPGVVERAGGRIHFHRIAIKPGKPLLGATTENGRLVMGLPGNPGSVLATARRYGLPALRRLGGWREMSDPGGVLRIEEAALNPYPLLRFLPVRVTVPGTGRIVRSRGSGDVVAAARSDGLVEIPAGAAGSGPFHFLPWRAG